MPLEVNVLTLPRSIEMVSRKTEGRSMDLIPEIFMRKEVHDEYGGSRYSGITPTKEAKKVFIWSNESGPHHGYQDGWSEDKNIYYYTGAGLRGDQELEAPRTTADFEAHRKWTKFFFHRAKAAGGSAV